MKHIHNSKMDESEEYLHQTISSHFKIIFSYFDSLANLSLNKNFDLEYLESSIMNFIMKPSTSIFLVSLIILLFFSHTFDFWLNVFYNKLPFKSFTRNLRSSFGAGNLKNVIYELRANQVGIYAIQGRRPHMEDNFSFKFDTLNGECLLNGRKLENLRQSNVLNQTHNFEIVAVYDGHGGTTASSYAQENLLTLVKKSLDELIVNNKLNQCKELNIETISKILTEQILKLDSTLCDRLKNSGDIAGTTALIALRIVHTNELIIANIGDSRGVLCDSIGNTIALSFDHKPNHPREFKRIYDSGGFVRYNGVWRVAGILACSRALGDYPLKEKNYVIAVPDILTFNLNELKPKFAILASDGLFDFFSNEAAVKFVKDKMEELLSTRFAMSKNELSLELAKQLTLEAYKRGSSDNITVVIWIFDYELIKPTVRTASFSEFKEIKVKTKKANELEEIQIKQRSKFERKVISVGNEFTREINYQTEEITCDSELVEFNVGDLVYQKDCVELSKETSSEQKDQSSNDKKKKSKKVINLKLNLRFKDDKKSNDENGKELNKDLNEKLDEESNKELSNESNNNESPKQSSEEACKESNEEQNKIDKNANSIFEVRLKDDYNLVNHHSPKKPKNTNKLISDTTDKKADDEFFDCK